MNVQGTHYRTIWLDPLDAGCIKVIDQTKLPHEFDILDLRTLTDAAKAILDMQIRGAGLIGACAAFGMYLAALEAPDTSFDHFMRQAARSLGNTRPTAANLKWAINRQLQTMQAPASCKEKRQRLLQEAIAIADEDAEACRKIGEHGLPIIESLAEAKKGLPVEVLTHCNAGWLAFVDYGSATAPLYAAYDAGIPLHVWVDETRPRNQGASLTAWELGQHGVAHDLIPDNAGGHLMQHGMVDFVITGSDRVTLQGDAANKIGTYLKAVAAFDNKVPFYVALPSSTFDFALLDGLKEIPIEERNAQEVRTITGKDTHGALHTVQICPDSTPARNWGFDVTPARLISALVCERGWCPATQEGIRSLFPGQVNASKDEGYIKFQPRQSGTDSVPAPELEAINRIRTRLFDLGLIGCYPNGVGFGNISMRLSKYREFVISGSATGATRILSADQYACIESFDLEQNQVSFHGKISPSSETMSHGAIYAANAGIGGVIHIHSRNLFESLLQKGCARTASHIPYGTPQLGKAIIDLVGLVPGVEGIFVTEGHEEGVFAYAARPQRAYDLLFTLYTALKDS